jgi:hypothetical protein
MSFLLKRNKLNKIDRIDKIHNETIEYLRKRIFQDFPLVKLYVEDGIYFYKEIQFRNLSLICWNNLEERKLDIIIENWIDSKNFIIKKDKEYSKLECSICFEKLNKKNSISLKCGHDYHLNCLLEWSITKKNCPLCRNEFIL